MYCSPRSTVKGAPGSVLSELTNGDHIVFPTDFPHSFTFERFVEEVRGFVERNDLPPDLSRKILWDIRKGCMGSNYWFPLPFDGAQAERTTSRRTKITRSC